MSRKPRNATDDVAQSVLLFRMIRIGVRELRQHASRYLEMVKAGNAVEVTERGVLVAVLVAPPAGEGVRDRLIASGQLVPAEGPFQMPIRKDVASEGRAASDVLQELREERSS